MAVMPADAYTVMSQLESADRLLIQQVFKPVANEYRISVPAVGSTEEGRTLLYVKQKRLKVKEDIRFRVSPDDDAHLFMIKSKSVFEFRGRHEVLDARDTPIGLLEKDLDARSSAVTGTSATRPATSCLRVTKRAGSSPSCAVSPVSSPSGSRY
jgi:hypothetical protein